MDGAVKKGLLKAQSAEELVECAEPCPEAEHLKRAVDSDPLLLHFSPVRPPLSAQPPSRAAMSSRVDSSTLRKGTSTSDARRADAQKQRQAAGGSKRAITSADLSKATAGAKRGRENEAPAAAVAAESVSLRARARVGACVH